MSVGHFLTPVVLVPLAISAVGTCLGAVLTYRAKSQRKRLQRTLAIHLRLETEWKNARNRMYLAGPIDPSHLHLPGTKYSFRRMEPTKASTNRDFLRYIGG